MRLEWLEDIIAVYDAGSLRAAADQRLLTASAFTRRIKAVENALGGELFDRSNKPVTLRPHVVELIPRMREIAASFRQMKSELSSTGGGAPITRVICQHTLSVSWTPRLAKFLASKDVHMRIKSGSKDECKLSVLKKDTDFAIIYEEPHRPMPEDDKVFDRIFLTTEQFLPVAALEQNERLKQSVEAKHFPLIAYPRNLFLGEVLERALTEDTGIISNTSVLAEAGLGPAVLEFVREGVGIGWLPYSLVSSELAQNTLTDLSEALPPFSLDVVLVRSSTNPSNRRSAIWDWIKEDLVSKFHSGR